MIQLLNSNIIHIFEIHRYVLQNKKQKTHDKCMYVTAYSNDI